MTNRESSTAGRKLNCISSESKQVQIWFKLVCTQDEYSYHVVYVSSKGVITAKCGMALVIRSNFYILSLIQFVCSLLVWVFCGMIREGFILSARILLALCCFGKEESFDVDFWMWLFPRLCFCFLFRVWSIFRTEWRILTRSLSFRMISLSFVFLPSVGFVKKSRQDCRRT